MQIIPVIDLYKGQVVHAVAGNRKNYKAIDSKICSSADPFDVVDSYLSVFSFKSIYIADLNTLEHQGDNSEIVLSICSEYPTIELWLDSSISLIEDYLQQGIQNNIRFILSSENISSISVYNNLLKQYAEHDYILSLDFKDDKLLGNYNLLKIKNKWPKDVIVLNLNNVGVRQGYNYPAELTPHNLCKNFNVYYGGGIRNAKDINNLKTKGFTGVLISTALHEKALTSDEVHSINQSL